MSTGNNGIGSIIKQLRLRADLSRVQLGEASGISASHLHRIENGHRFPSAKVLRKIAPHLNVGEMELLVLAGYVSSDPFGVLSDDENARLDPYVVALLSQEPVEVQRAVISIFSMMKYIAGGIAYEQGRIGNNGDGHNDSLTG